MRHPVLIITGLTAALAAGLMIHPSPFLAAFLASVTALCGVMALGRS